MRPLTLLLLMAGCAFGQPLPASDPVSGNSKNLINEGVAAFKGAHYPEAVRSFEAAVRAAPGDVNAHLYLATALMSQYIPGAQGVENQEFASRAEVEFRRALELDSRNAVALESLASLAYSQATGIQDLNQKTEALDRAAGWYKRLIEINPDNKQAHYSLAVIGWSKFYPALMASRTKLGMKPEDPGPLPDAAEIASLRSGYESMIEDSISHLNRALELDPQYDDAMAYMNLLVRERGDLASSVEQYRADVQSADDWVQKALAAKKSKAESKSAFTTAPPPPPPPPPPPGQARKAGDRP